jgi:hypothetical protein
MERNSNNQSSTSVAVIQEPLAHYYPFLRDDRLIARAQTSPLVQAYLRWQYVRRGGLDTYTQLEFAPTGWEGYVVGLPADQQNELLQLLGNEMLQRLQFVGHQAGVPADRLLAAIAEEKFTQRTAHLLEPIFFSALMYMRAVGQNGLAMRTYSSWRTAYERELFQLEQQLHCAQSAVEKHRLVNRIAAKQWELQQKLTAFTHGRLSAAARYEEVRQQVAAQVATLVQTVDAPLAVDIPAACVRYLLPAAPTINTAPEESLTPGAPEWYIPLRNLPLIGHPLIRAATAES